MIRLAFIVMAILPGLCAISQYVGIGTNTPDYPLTVISPGNTGIVQKKDAVEIGIIASPALQGLYTLSNHNLNFATNNAAGQMTLTTAGNLGIGTGLPTARLDVNGTVRIRGGNPASGHVLTAVEANGIAEWKRNAMSGSRIVFIPHPAFIPDVAKKGYITLAFSSGRRPDYPTSGANKMLAPLSLPVGSMLKEITWYFDDWNETQNMTFTLLRDNNGTATTVSQVSSTGNVSGSGPRTLTVTLNHVIPAQFHWLEVNVDNWPENYTLQIIGAKISYEL